MKFKNKLNKKHNINNGNSTMLSTSLTATLAEIGLLMNNNSDNFITIEKQRSGGKVIDSEIIELRTHRCNAGSEITPDLHDDE